MSGGTSTTFDHGGSSASPTRVDSDEAAGRGAVAVARLAWNRLEGWRVALALLAVGTLVRIPQLNNTIFEAFSFRQTQTAFVAREYARNGIDLFRTPLPVFGPNADVPMEMPLFQAATALIEQAGIGSTSMSARLLGLVSFQMAAVFLYTLVKRWHGTLAGVASLALFQFTPFGLQWGAAALIEFPAVALALGMVVGLDSWFSRGSRWWLVLGSASAVLAFLVKATTPPTWCFLLLASSIVVVRELGWAASWRRLLVGYTVGPAAGALAALAWVDYADGVKESHPLTRFVTSDALNDWNYGTIEQRMVVDAWTTVAERVHDAITGAGLALVAIALVLVWARREGHEHVYFTGWLLAVLGAPFVFFNLYVVHDYYLVAVYPALTAILGISIAVVIARCSTTSAVQWTGAFAAVAVVLASTAFTALGQSSIQNYRRSNQPPNLALAMAAASSPDDNWILVNCDWDPVYLFFADRKGVMFREMDSGGFWFGEDPTSYTRLAICPGGPEPDLTRVLPLGFEARELPGPDRIFEVVPA